MWRWRWMSYCWQLPLSCLLLWVHKVRELQNKYYMCMCVCAHTNLLTHACVCDTSCLVCSSGVQCLVVQGTQFWDWCRSHTTLHFNRLQVALPTVQLANLLGAKRAVRVCVTFHMPWGQCLREEEPRSASGQSQHFWVHYFLDFLWGIWAIHVARKEVNSRTFPPRRSSSAAKMKTFAVETS